MKVHLHSEQFDEHTHSWCGRGILAVHEDQFEATPESERCYYCNKEWFPYGQPNWHFKYARERVINELE